MVNDEEKIRLGEDGWKGRYYAEKLGASEEAQVRHNQAVFAGRTQPVPIHALLRQKQHNSPVSGVCML